jgi:glyoxalase family protein
VGLGAVTLTVPTLERTARFLTDVLGFRADERESEVFVPGPGHPGAGLRLSESNDRGSDGAGGVHHVAWLARDHDELLSWQTRLTSFRVANSGLIDRFYFQSLYFRIPGNILFEIATAGPGFTADGESLEHLGERLSLPPFLEGRREAIEAGLRPLDTARS